MRRILVLGRGGAGKSTLAARLTGGPRWVIDGDLGLDFPLWRCAVRALRRSRGNLAFWRWLIGYRRGSLPTVMAAIAANAGDAELHVLRTPRAVERFLGRARTRSAID